MSIFSGDPRLHSLASTQRSTWIGSGLSCIAFFVVSTLLLLRFGSPPAGHELDLSWSSVLGWAHSSTAQWGVDLVFTYGPLGFLMPMASYFPDSYRDFWLGQIILTAVSASIVSWMFWRLDNSLRLCLAVVLWVGFIWIATDVLWLTTVAALMPMLSLASSNEPSRKLVAVLLSTCAAFYVAALTLLKFSFFPALIIYWALATTLLWQRFRWPTGLLALVSVPVALLILWIVTDQSLSNFPSYLTNSWEMASGYGSAMGLTTSLAVDLGAIFLAVTIFSLLLWRLFAVRSQHADLIAMLMVMSVLALGWRSLMTRMVPEKLIVIFPFFALLLLVGLTVGHPTRRERLVALVVVMTLSVLTVWSSPIPWRETMFSVPAGHARQNLSIIRSPAPYEQSFQSQWQTKQAESSMLKLRDRIGGSRVDLLSYSQGLIFLNQLNYAPRPIFQSYSAYTSRLARLNESYFLGPLAPDYVLVSIDPIDGRLPSNEDPLALIALLRRYDAEAAENGFILFRKSERTPEPIGQPASDVWKAYEVGGFVELPDPAPNMLTLMFVKVRPTLLGSLVSLAMREAPLYIEVRTTSQLTHRRRLVRQSAESGFLIDPFLLQTIDLTRWVANFPPSEVAGQPEQVRIDTLSPLFAKFHSDTVEIAFKQLPIARARTVDADEDLIDMVYPGFSTPPTAEGGNIQLSSEFGSRVLFMHAPAHLDFQLGSGSHTLAATAGVMTEVSGKPECANADGIQVVLELIGVDGSQKAVAKQSVAAPAAGAREPWIQRIHQSLHVPPGSQLRLRIDPGGTNNLDCDWAYVRDLKIEPVNTGSFGTEGSRSKPPTG